MQAPSFVLTSATNLVQLQKQLKGVAKQIFEFRSTKNGALVITKSMVNFQAVKYHFDSQNLSYYSFFPKSEKLIKVVIRHLPINTPAEDTAEGLVDIGFYVIGVKQMSTARRSPEVTATTKSQDVFRLSSLCHISNKLELYKSQNALLLQLPEVWPHLG
jgi:hypothetical protein